jgi:NAD(P)-dependent dehydrogenase (short-subunit alcohol dehydrogenase family)
LEVRWLTYPFPQAKAGLIELRKTKGSIVWVSSGAANKPYTAWGTYGSSKAAINHLSAHFATEEQDITSITIAPGRVNTEMQAVLRAQGKDTMAKAQYDTFVEAFEQGTLLKPEQPGNVIAGFVAEPSKELSGKSVNWNSPEMVAWQA